MEFVNILLNYSVYFGITYDYVRTCIANSNFIGSLIYMIIKGVERKGFHLPVPITFPVGRCDIKISSDKLNGSHYQDKTVSRPSYNNMTGLLYLEIWDFFISKQGTAHLHRDPAVAASQLVMTIWTLIRWKHPFIDRIATKYSYIQKIVSVNTYMTINYLSIWELNSVLAKPNFNLDMYR